jgi:uncharacterized protein with PhoU and TrkA domain
LLAIRQNESWFYKPEPNHLLEPNSLLVVTTTPSDLKVLKEVCSQKHF